MVTQAPAGQQAISQAAKKLIEWKEASAPQPASAPPDLVPPHDEEQPSLPASPVTQPEATSLALSQDSSLPQASSEPEVTVVESEPQAEAVDLSVTTSPSAELVDVEVSTEEALTTQTRDVDDILKEVIEEEREKAGRVRNQ